MLLGACCNRLTEASPQTTFDNPVPLVFVDLEEEPFPLRPTYLVHKKGELNPQKELYIDTIKEIWT